MEKSTDPESDFSLENRRQTDMSNELKSQVHSATDQDLSTSKTSVDRALPLNDPPFFLATAKEFGEKTAKEIGKSLQI